jgi:hypothetical protein
LSSTSSGHSQAAFDSSNGRATDRRGSAGDNLTQSTAQYLADASRGGAKVRASLYAMQNSVSASVASASDAIVQKANSQAVVAAAAAVRELIGVVSAASSAGLDDVARDAKVQLAAAQARLSALNSTFAPAGQQLAVAAGASSRGFPPPSQSVPRARPPAAQPTPPVVAQPAPTMRHILPPRPIGPAAPVPAPAQLCPFPIMLPNSIRATPLFFPASAPLSASSAVGGAGMAPLNQFLGHQQFAQQPQPLRGTTGTAAATEAVSTASSTGIEEAKAEEYII